MSFLERPKARFDSIASILAASAPAYSSRALPPGCMQCGRLLVGADRRRNRFSGKCHSCECWVSDEDEAFEDGGY